MAVSSADEDDSKKRKKEKKSSKKSSRKSAKCKRSSSPDSSDSSSTERRKRKDKKARKKSKKQKRSAQSDRSRTSDTESAVTAAAQTQSSDIADRLRLLSEPMLGPLLSLADTSVEAKPKGPMTKEQWDRHQNTLRRVHDPETGRTRLIRGDGEIMEEIVTRDMHIAINKAATKADGAYFETVLGLRKHK